MPPLPPAPAVADQSPILDQARQLMEIAPRLAFDKASLLRDPLLRERLRRDAFLTMTRLRPRDAAAVLPEVRNARWLASVHFAQALDVAMFTVRDQPELSKQFLIATATRHPAAALRELRQYIELPYGALIRDAATKAAATPGADLLLLKIRQNPSTAAGLPAGEILRLAAAARTEDERETAIQLLRTVPWDLPADPATLRGALALLAETGAPLKAPIATIRLALTGIDDAEDPLAEAGKAALILAVSPISVDDALPATTLGRLLRSLRQPSEPSLAIRELFPQGLCLQRYIFHNDDDGVESYESFLRAYEGDPNWEIVKSSDGVIHLSSRAARERRIEVYANIPIDLQRPENYQLTANVLSRQDAVTRALGKQRPSVIVHRGHDHHFEVTRRYLNGEARLVFLGSCRGMSNVEDVVTRCRRAQMIATRGIGTTAVNDTFLRALNRRLLEPGDALDWNIFWAGLQPKLGANEHFQAYVQPNKNEAARFLAAWYREALSAP